MLHDTSIKYPTLGSHIVSHYSISIMKMARKTN